MLSSIKDTNFSENITSNSVNSNYVFKGKFSSVNVFFSNNYGYNYETGKVAVHRAHWEIISLRDFGKLECTHWQK